MWWFDSVGYAAVMPIAACCGVKTCTIRVDAKKEANSEKTRYAVKVGGYSRLPTELLGEAVDRGVRVRGEGTEETGWRRGICMGLALLQACAPVCVTVDQRSYLPV